MKKVILLALCLAMLAGMMTSVSAATTTVVNDKGDNTGLWYLRDNKTGDSFGLDSPGADGTGKCIKFVSVDGRVLLLANNGNRITYKKGCTYTISWKMKAAQDNRTVYLCFFNGNMTTTPAVISHAQVGGNTGKYIAGTSWQNYSCTFTVDSIGTATTTQNNLTFRVTNAGTLYLDDIVITETPCYTVSVTAGANGTVTKDGAAITSDFYVTEGKSITLNLTPDENYLPKVKVNGADYAVTNNQVTLTVNQATAVDVTFERIPDIAPGIVEDASYNWFKDENGTPTIFSYHKLSAFNTGEADLEYGVKLWNTQYPDSAVSLSAYDPATNQPAKAVPGAQYAIKAYGKAIDENSTYAVQPFIGEELGESETLSHE